MAGMVQIGGYNPAPKFDGENPQQWISNIQAYFNLKKIPENRRLQIVELNLEGGALEWYQWMKKKKFFNNYHDLIGKIMVCFEPSDFAEYSERLSRLTQKGTVAQFQAEFVSIARNIVTGVSEAQLVSIFVEGLKIDLKGLVQAGEPSTMEEAFALATYHEGWNQIMSRLDRSNWGWTEPKEVKPNKGPPPPPGRKKLSAAEMREKRAKGLCFNCDKKFNPKQPCPCGTTKLQGV